MSATTTVVVWLTADQYTWLDDAAAAGEAAENEWLSNERQARGIPDGDPLPLSLWADVAERRPTLWPRQVHLVNTALRTRLALPDLAGPWEPWTEEERAQQHVRGRRRGTPNQGFDLKASYDLAAAAVDAGRLAAHRISAPYLAALERERLIGRSARRGRQAAARRAELQAQIYTLGRIIRQGINLQRGV